MGFHVSQKTITIVDCSLAQLAVLTENGWLPFAGALPFALKNATDATILQVRLFYFTLSIVCKSSFCAHLQTFAPGKLSIDMAVQLNRRNCEHFTCMSHDWAEFHTYVHTVHT